MKDIHYYMIILYMNVPLFNHFSHNLSKKLAFGHSGDIIEWGRAEGAARARPVVWDATKSQKMINADLLAMPWPTCLSRRVYIPPNFQPKSSQCRPSFFCHEGLGHRAHDAQVFGLHWPPTTRASSIDLHDNIWQFNRKSVGPSTDNDHGCPSPPPRNFFLVPSHLDCTGFPPMGWKSLRCNPSMFAHSIAKMIASNCNMRSIVRLHRRLFWIFMCRIWFAWSIYSKNVFELCNYSPDISFYGEHLAAFNIITQYVQKRMPFALKIFHWLRTSKNPLYREVQDCRPWLSFIATLLRQPENSTFHNMPRVLPKVSGSPKTEFG